MADQSDSSHSSRHEIVSSLINLSETICEKALELEGVEGAEGIVGVLNSLIEMNLNHYHLELVKRKAP